MTNHAPKMISPKHFRGTLCGAKGPITMNRPTCAECAKLMGEKNALAAEHGPIGDEDAPPK